MKGATLAVLAAGMGSRYGGLKQMDSLGSKGEVLLDYSVFDALRSGFDDVVFIIRRDIEEDFRKAVLSRMESKTRFRLAFQEMDSLIPPDLFARASAAGRTKPWGTAHALLCAADQIDGPFAVINADDFYGREAFEALGRHLCGPDSREPAIVPYRLEKTLSAQGTVARGVCEIEGGYLRTVDELMAIERKDGRIVNTFEDGSTRELADDCPVSMNFWGFPPDVIPHIRKYFDNFLEDFARDVTAGLKSECFIPRAADWLIRQGIARIKALPSASHWFGVTYREDRETAARKLAELTAAGVYPKALWE
ncbi:MAG: hypothetical protein FWE09_02865 [Treponema sp.]|nr:hypothetical protein [Treponema sp.]